MKKRKKTNVFITCTYELIGSLKSFAIENVVREKRDMEKVAVWCDRNGLVDTTETTVEAVWVLEVWQFDVVTFGLCTASKCVQK